MNPNARPPIVYADGRSASVDFDEQTLDRLWPRLLVLRPGFVPSSLAAMLRELARDEVIPMPSGGSARLDDLANALWRARFEQQRGWRSQKWPLEQVTGYLRERRIATEWAMPIASEFDDDDDDPFVAHRATGLRGVVYMNELDAERLAVSPGEALINVEAFVAPRPMGILRRMRVDPGEYREACESVAAELVRAARISGITAVWTGDWQIPVVLYDVQYITRIPAP